MRKRIFAVAVTSVVMSGVAQAGWEPSTPWNGAVNVTAAASSGYQSQTAWSNDRQRSWVWEADAENGPDPVAPTVNSSWSSSAISQSINAPAGSYANAQAYWYSYLYLGWGGGNGTDSQRTPSGVGGTPYYYGKESNGEGLKTNNVGAQNNISHNAAYGTVGGNQIWVKLNYYVSNGTVAYPNATASSNSITITDGDLTVTP